MPRTIARSVSRQTRSREEKYEPAVERRDATLPPDWCGRIKGWNSASQGQGQSLCSGLGAGGPATQGIALRYS
jgi:hypothetical protein